MLTEILIKPFIEDLERRGIEDTDAHVEGFQAGMAALSDILSENMDYIPQLFVYLGMAISEGMQWVESQVSERDNVAPIFAEKFPSVDDPRWIFPNNDYIGCDCYGITHVGDVLRGKLDSAIPGYFVVGTKGVTNIIPLESRPRERQPTPSSDFK